ncbi:MAG: FAD-dependent oxidoreductase [Verrucomicrobia bacterium]|nr:FAD-dependent oxidoreductase [Verrucomicrobiota bacterium]
MLGHPSLNPTFDIIIVGAGIVGAACAAECAGAGLKVMVLDRGPIGGGTTGAGMGHLVVLDDSEAQFALTHYSRRLWNERAPDLPPSIEYEQCGTLWVAADEQEMAEVRRKANFYTRRGVRVEELDAGAVATAEPHLRRDLVGGLLVVEDAVIYPPCATRCLIELAIARKARLQIGAAVKAILPEGGVVLADGSRLSAGMVVNAAGPWSPELHVGLPVRKRKGHLVITERYPGYVQHQIIELGYLKSAHSVGTDSVAFNVQPRKTGQILIGSSRQYAAEGTEINTPILHRMLQRALEYLPELGQLSVSRCWAGHRAATPDKLPLIGPTPDNDKIWLATGHEGLGITTSLGTGRLLADLLLKRPTEIPSAPYAPARLLRASETRPSQCVTA